MKTLVIAEKPSVAADLARVLGKFTKHQDYVENDHYVVTSALGHVVELCMPQDFDAKWGRWTLENLPIIPEKFLLKPIEKTEGRFKMLKRLMHRKDVDTVINACDAGREGELIFTYLYELAECQKATKRLWLSSMTTEAIKQAFHSLREDSEVATLREAARCRSEADWLIGINGTRAVTLRMFGRNKPGNMANLASVGRVQTPTLTLVCEREHEIRNFKPRAYWTLRAQFGVVGGTYEGVYQKEGFKKSDDEHDRVDRLWNQRDAEALLKQIQDAAAPFAIVEKKKRTTQSPNRLYDLTMLQREANNRFGYTADRTLKIAQALYEKHKVLTYPRTDSKALPEDYAHGEVPRVLQFLLETEYGSFAKEILERRWVRGDNKRVFNNKEVSDHSALIPTGHGDVAKLGTDEAKIFDMVTRRFLAIFFPSAEFDVTTRLTHVDKHTFKTEGKVLALPGWLAVYGKAVLGGDSLVALTAEDGAPPAARSLKPILESDFTNPPPRYTEATLLAAMESAGKLVEDDELAEAMKERGLGTPATRAQIIEHLINLHYMDRNQRELMPTSKAENLLEFLKAVHVDVLTSPTMTGEWEYRLKQIQEGAYSRPEFMQGIANVTRQIVDSTRDFKMLDNANQTRIISPSDGKPLLETPLSYRSQDGKIIIYKFISQRKMTEDEVQQLLNERSLGPLDGFRSRMGKPFAATLQLDEANKVRFVFENQHNQGETAQSIIEDIKTYPVVGACPVCGKGQIYATPGAYVCERTQENAACRFKVTKSLLGKEISLEEFTKLITAGKTGLLENFKSKRTGRFFSAFLVLKKGGDIGFEFEDKKDGKKKNDDGIEAVPMKKKRSVGKK